jgi:hypothetical protein
VFLRSLCARQRRWVGSCYNPLKDVVSPVDFVMTARERRRTRDEAQVALNRALNGGCGRAGSQMADRDIFLFMSGTREDMASWYSQGVRQEVWALLQSYNRGRDSSRRSRRLSSASNWSGVVFQGRGWNIGHLRKAQYCLCPSGWGFGWRTYLAVATLCIPVIVQPLVQQAYHDLLPFENFSLFVDIADLRRLPEILRAVPPSRVCELRAAAARYYRTLLWEEDGLAYEMLQLSLCQRAARLLQKRPTETLPDWTACTRTSAESLLDSMPSSE